MTTHSWEKFVSKDRLDEIRKSWKEFSLFMFLSRNRTDSSETVVLFGDQRKSKLRDEGVLGTLHFLQPGLVVLNCQLFLENLSGLVSRVPPHEGSRQCFVVTSFAPEAVNTDVYFYESKTEDEIYGARVTWDMGAGQLGNGGSFYIRKERWAEIKEAFLKFLPPSS